MKEMAQTGGGMSFYGSLPDAYKVAINGNHTMIDKILKSESEEEKTKLAKQSFDLALLAQGLLTGKELTAFVKRSLEML
jgi:molecular chaperone HtpG